MGMTNDDLESALNIESSKVKVLKKKISKIKMLLNVTESLGTGKFGISKDQLIKDIKEILSKA